MRCWGFEDRLQDGFWCTCGERFWPDCDASSISIVDGYEEHLRSKGIDPDVLLAKMNGEIPINQDVL